MQNMREYERGRNDRRDGKAKGDMPFGQDGERNNAWFRGWSLQDSAIKNANRDRVPRKNRNRPVTNTAKNRNPARKGALGKRETVFNARQNAMTATMKAAKNPAAYRMPGSMRGW